VILNTASIKSTFTVSSPHRSSNISGVVQARSAPQALPAGRRRRHETAEPSKRHHGFMVMEVNETSHWRP
jgi:hypothetical protein